MKKIEINRYTLLLFTAAAFFFVSSCKKNEVTNPYASLTPAVDNDNPDLAALPEGSFAWLHAKVFRPTCANSGCHDGTFEPEFRSIGSAYNSIVNHPCISNTPDYAFTHRVVPGNADSSFMLLRLTVDVENTSGIMPAVVDPQSDWNSNKEYYISKIRDWINGGAKDVYGNPAPAAEANMPPMVYGLVVFPHNNTTDPYPREENSPYGIGSIEVPSELIDIWVLPYDDNAYPTGFDAITLQASSSSLDFSGAVQSIFNQEGPVNAVPFGEGSAVPFYYKATLDLSNSNPGDLVYLRTLIDDGVQSGFTEIPNSESMPLWFLIFSLKVI